MIKDNKVSNNFKQLDENLGVITLGHGIGIRRLNYFEQKQVEAHHALWY